jgi:hypothetical protein
MVKSGLEDLRKNSGRVLYLPKPAQQAVEAYLHIRVDGAVAACPYHINPGLRSTNRALLGKGSPAEIEAAAAKYFKKYAMYPGNDAEKLRSFLTACGIGVDCSGFASWVMNGVTQTRLGRPLWKCLKFPGLRRRAISRLRPVENISAKLLTGSANARPLDDLTDVKPGDLMRVANGHHVLVVTEVGLNSAGHAHYFQYAQSSCMYRPAGGVCLGHAIIKKPRGSLLEQAWFDGGAENIIAELIKEGGDDSRIVRLNALA